MIEKFWLINGTLTGITTLGQSGPKKKVMKRYFIFPKALEKEPHH